MTASWARRSGSASTCRPRSATYVENSETLREFRNFLFMRIVPILRDIGLWGPKLRAAFEEMGVIGWADTDIDAEMAERREGGPGSRRGPRRPHGPREGGGGRGLSPSPGARP